MRSRWLPGRSSCRPGRRSLCWCLSAVRGWRTVRVGHLCWCASMLMPAAASGDCSLAVGTLCIVVSNASPTKAKRRETRGSRIMALPLSTSSYCSIPERKLQATSSVPPYLRLSNRWDSMTHLWPGAVVCRVMVPVGLLDSVFRVLVPRLVVVAPAPDLLGRKAVP